MSLPIRTPTDKPRAVALREWRRQLAAGERTPTTFDALWAATGAEQLALEHETDGLPEIAAHYWSEARAILARAAKTEAA